MVEESVDSILCNTQLPAIRDLMIPQTSHRLLRHHSTTDGVSIAVWTVNENENGSRNRFLGVLECLQAKKVGCQFGEEVGCGVELF